jgi:hypothetical protein
MKMLTTGLSIRASSNLMQKVFDFRQKLKNATA